MSIHITSTENTPITKFLLHPIITDIIFFTTIIIYIYIYYNDIMV